MGEILWANVGPYLLFTADFVALAPGRELVCKVSLFDMQVNYLNIICADNKWLSGTGIQIHSRKDKGSGQIHCCILTQDRDSLVSYKLPIEMMLIRLKKYTSCKQVTLDQNTPNLFQNHVYHTDL